MRSPRSIVALVILALAAAPALAGKPASQQVQRAGGFCLKGEHALQAGNLGKASELFKQALEIVPQFAEAHVGLGHVAMAERRFEDALKEYSIAGENYGEIDTALYEMKVERYAAAQTEITALIDSYRAQSTLAPDPIRLLKLDAAITRLRNLPAPSPQHDAVAPPRLDFFLGNALFRLGRVDEAIVRWEACVGRDSSIAPAWNNLAAGYLSIGAESQARETLARAEAVKIKILPELKARLEKPRGPGQGGGQPKRTTLALIAAG